MARPHSDGRKLVLFKNGTSGRFYVNFYLGACMAGDPTAYIVVDGKMVWVKPGESVEFIEA